MHYKLSARLDSQKRGTHTGRLLSYNSIYARAAIICGTSKMNNCQDGNIRKAAALVSALKAEHLDNKKHIKADSTLNVLSYKLSTELFENLRLDFFKLTNTTFETVYPKLSKMRIIFSKLIKIEQ
jgi:hypothetical protein